MATTAMKESHTLGATILPSAHGVEAAGQSWKIGAVLVDSSGSLAIGANDPSLGTILGVARVAATGVTAADVIYTPAAPNVVFEANLDDGSGTLALAQTHMHGRFGITLASEKFYIDQSDTTNIRVCVIGFRDAIGTVNGRVYFVFLPNATRTSITAV